MDGIVYGITASLGFAFWENHQYTYLYGEPTTKESLLMAWDRSFSAVTSHALDGVIMGFFIGRHYFRDYKTNTNLILALLKPVTLHGFYDWVLMEESINRNFMYLVMVVELGSNVIKEVKVGDNVYAIGHPKSLPWSFSAGMVSQIRPNHIWNYEHSWHRANVIQHEVPTYPGNSGGPLFDENGFMIGVNSFTHEGELLNLSVAIEELELAIRQQRQTRIALEYLSLL